MRRMAHSASGIAFVVHVRISMVQALIRNNGPRVRYFGTLLDKEKATVVSHSFFGKLQQNYTAGMREITARVPDEDIDRVTEWSLLLNYKSTWMN